MMRRSRFFAVAALALGACGGAAHVATGAASGTASSQPPPAATSNTDLATTILARLDEAAGCARAPSVFCLATRGWADGVAGEIPPGRHLFVGVALALVEEEPAGEALEQPILVGMGLRRDGAALAAMVAEPEIKDRAAAELVERTLAGIVAVLETPTAAPAGVPAPLYDFFAPLPEVAPYALVRGAHGWSFDGSGQTTELRKVGKVWLAIEIPHEGPRGIYLTIFTDRVRREP